MTCMLRSMLCCAIELEELPRVVSIGLKGFVVNRFQQTLISDDWAETTAENLAAVRYPVP